MKLLYGISMQSVAGNWDILHDIDPRINMSADIPIQQLLSNIHTITRTLRCNWRIVKYAAVADAKKPSVIVYTPTDVLGVRELRRR